MQVKIETAHQPLLQLLQPLIQAAQAWKLPINRSSTDQVAGADLVAVEAINKRELMAKLRALMPDGCDIGCGAGHVWIAGEDPDLPTPANPDWKPRLLLILDETTELL